MAYPTEDSLQNAFAGECKANRRYTFYAEKAVKEGYPHIARLFRAVAAAESVHARNHFDVMDAVGTTRDNLLAASVGEHQEITAMYPAYINHAKVDRNARAERSFTWANEVEKGHHEMFEAARELLKEGKEPEETAYYVCQFCGNTVTGSAPDKCPVCGAPLSAFAIIE